jgi:hypothetical protein
MGSIKMNETLYDLPAIESDCWSRIMDGVLQSSHPFHQSVFANGNTIGANMRMVVSLYFLAILLNRGSLNIAKLLY